MTTHKKNGRAAPAVAVTPQPAALPPPELEEVEYSPPSGYTLADFITLEFVDHYGDPMRLSSIVHALRGRGVNAESDAVSLALSRNPERFERLEPIGQGVYGLRLPLGPLNRKRQGRKLKESQR